MLLINTLCWTPNQVVKRVIWVENLELPPPPPHKNNFYTFVFGLIVFGSDCFWDLNELWIELVRDMYI